MPANATARTQVGAPLQTQPQPGRTDAPGGWVEINPRYRQPLGTLGLTTARAILDLPGEVVSGHPDRHVARVELTGWARALYLKRQHTVGWRERLRHQLAGLGWVSRCEREGHLLGALGSAGFPCPAWVAYGEDGRGRAFLLVEELTGVELRQLLSTTRLAPAARRQLADRLGQAVAELHAAGFDTPDLTAKHVFVDPTSFAVTLIDWQSARRVASLGMNDRVRAVAALAASLADHLADRRDRLRFLWTYRRVTRRNGFPTPGFSALVRAIDRESGHAGKRRSIRDQRQPVAATAEQRLVWLAGEAVCAVPDVAAAWPTPAVAAPFYTASAPPGEDPVRIRLPGGRPAELVRGRSFAPGGRFLARARSHPWRSPGVTLGRVLFHLQRYGLPAPQLLAFGQRETGRTTADWFALSEPPTGRPLAEWLSTPMPDPVRRDVVAQVGLLLRQLHDAGCRYTGAGPLFWVADEPAGRISVGGWRAVRIVRRIGARGRRADLLAVVRGLPTLTRTDCLRVIRGYHGARWADDPCGKAAARLAVARVQPIWS
ncbi:MAG: 3-deoxy-D-manno-octulosonic-acid kinase [Gemmataceae bacterium]|nr:3-deoxy-D-manno-octulosonic-acid kinase [Gemmataceae bacterium]